MNDNTAKVKTMGIGNLVSFIAANPEGRGMDVKRCVDELNRREREYLGATDPGPFLPLDRKPGEGGEPQWCGKPPRAESAHKQSPDASTCQHKDCTRSATHGYGYTATACNQHAGMVPVVLGADFFIIRDDEATVERVAGLLQLLSTGTSRESTDSSTHGIFNGQARRILEALRGAK